MGFRVWGVGLTGWGLGFRIEVHAFGANSELHSLSPDLKAQPATLKPNSVLKIQATTSLTSLYMPDAFPIRLYRSLPSRIMKGP